MPKVNKFVDYYELLQLSPKADSAAIHVMHYHLTEKYHPDTKNTGDAQKHRAVLQAYKVLSNPESRAQYDEDYRQHMAPPETVSASGVKQSQAGKPAENVGDGIEMERAKRQGLLYLLYQRRVNDMTKPNLTMRDFEAMLGYPKETLEFTIWYLKENDCLRPGDNGAYSISARGVEFYERTAMETQDLVVLPSPRTGKELAPMR